MQDGRRKTIGIIRGGKEDYQKSIFQGGEIISFIQNNLFDKLKPMDILIDRQEVWYLSGLPIKPADLISQIDLVWNFSHPNYLNVLENLSIPIIGHSSFAHSFSKSKEMLETHMKEVDVKIPRHFVIPVFQEDIDGPRDKYILAKAKEVLSKFPAPWIIKTFTPDSNTAIHLVKTFPQLIEALEDMVNSKKSILVEEFIAGKIISTHSISGFRNEEIYVFPPQNLLVSEKDKLINLAKKIHQKLALNHYLKSDFILNSKGDVFLFNLDFLPDFQEDSHFSQSCTYVASDKKEIILHLMESVL